MTGAGPWQSQGQWYRGCLHIHTQASDGSLSPADVVEKYRGAGYHFICITDHDRFTDASGATSDEFVTLGGIEITAGANELGRPYHIIGVGIEQSIRLATDIAPPHAIAAIRERGGLPFVAHPYWSGHTFADLMGLDGVAGLEVYNGVCDPLSGKGLSAVHWDDVLARGKRWLGVAVDDFHWGRGPDFAAGWIVARAEALHEKALVKAISQGLFYSSQGPRILDLQLSGRTIKVRCSGSRRIDCLYDSEPGTRLESAPGKSLFEGEFHIPENATWARVQCLDAAGLAAWSNPIFLT